MNLPYTHSMVLFVVSILSACETSDDNIWPPPKNGEISFELAEGTKDTINKIVYGYKQGKWILHKGNNPLREITDTVYYRNDTMLVQKF